MTLVQALAGAQNCELFRMLALVAELLVVEFVTADEVIELSFGVSAVCELRLVSIVLIVIGCNGSSFAFLVPQELLQVSSELLIEQSGVRRGSRAGSGSERQRRGGGG